METLIENLIKWAGPGAVFFAGAVYIFVNRKLYGTLDALKVSLHNDSERNSVEHVAITASLKALAKETHEVNLFVRTKRGEG